MRIIEQEWVEEYAKYLIAYPFFESKPIHTNETSRVYSIGNYMVKCDKNYHYNPLLREYRIGVEMNKKYDRHLVRTVGYFRTEEYTFLVTSLVRGQGFFYFQKTLKENRGNRLRKLATHIIYILMELQHLFKFNHNDLHLGNIIVSEDEEKTFEYIIEKDKKVNITSPYNITFIDLAYSRFEGMPDGYFYVNDMAYVVPAVYDPQIDLALFCGFWFINNINNESEIYQKLVENNIYEKEHLINLHVYQGICNTYKIMTENKEGIKLNEICGEEKDLQIITGCALYTYKQNIINARKYSNKEIYDCALDFFSRQ